MRHETRALLRFDITEPEIKLAFMNFALLFSTS